MQSCVILVCGESKRWEKPQKWNDCVRKATGEAQVCWLHRDCAIKLPLSLHGVGIPFIASFINLSSFPVHFIAMIFELLFPVKTFQLLRGRKILCKQSCVHAGNGLHLSIQGNPIICMRASVSPPVPVFHLFDTTMKWEVPSFAVTKPYSTTHPPVPQSLVVLSPPQTCASRLSREQARVRAVWRQASSLRSTFTQLRTFTDRWAWPAARIPPAVWDSTRTSMSFVSHTHKCNHSSFL